MVEMVSDIYNTVVRDDTHVGHTVFFRLKCILPNLEEVDLINDQSMLNLFILHENGSTINVYVYGLAVNKTTVGNYTINGSDGKVIPRLDLRRRGHLNHTPSVFDWSSRLSKGTVNGGGGTGTSTSSATRCGSGVVRIENLSASIVGARSKFEENVSTVRRGFVSTGGSGTSSDVAKAKSNTAATTEGKETEINDEMITPHVIFESYETDNDGKCEDDSHKDYIESEDSQSDYDESDDSDVSGYNFDDYHGTYEKEQKH
ncbi:uncharacterized protein LOC122061603 isoform X2 [Macadamia integrifolia]|uniref:uncharacterized protein LOC122061603 isoform X2 n=1 Tax=Macadamia integrifolia TaxID=60698 RepID=UPI001C532179|nr:uncharacterized protein LOC122061603 isoform X2 [Macadamia integrifolia]